MVNISFTEKFPYLLHNPDGKRTSCCCGKEKSYSPGMAYILARCEKLCIYTWDARLKIDLLATASCIISIPNVVKKCAGIYASIYRLKISKAFFPKTENIFQRYNGLPGGLRYKGWSPGAGYAGATFQIKFRVVAFADWNRE